MKKNRIDGKLATRDPAHESVNLWTLVPEGETLSSLSLQPSSLDITRWLYDEPTGLLTAKIYADGHGPSYDYTPEGQLAARMWVRETEVESVMVPVTTAYTYADSGELLTVTYNDGTPGVTFTYDRLGRQETVIDALGTRSFVHDPVTLALVAEQHAEGEMARLYDPQGRSVGLALFAQGSTQALYHVAYDYDALGRFHSISSFVHSVTSVVEYSYLQGSDQLTGWTSNDGNSHTRTFEPNRNLITGVENLHGANLVSSFTYTNDELGRRTERIDLTPTLPSVTNTFGYNIRSEVIEALMGQDTYGYNYDPIGNRLASIFNTHTNTYAANELNQYVEIDNADLIEPVYDADGNMTEYGDWTFTWDGEHRLTEIVKGATRLVFNYDYMSRRIRKRVYDDLTPTLDRSYIYDGWNVLLEIDLMQTTPEIARGYIWGLDLSQSLQGAGGVGGLLLVTTDDGQTTAHYAPAYDANGNITEYTDTNGSIVAHYEYDSFGNITTQTGPLADEFPHRFSTKYTDDETGLVYYGYRYYNPELGRWINRDPIEEEGGIHIYRFNSNDGLNFVDLLGLHFWRWIDYAPIFGTIRTRWRLYIADSYPGTKVAHYKTPGVTYAECCHNEILANDRCSRGIRSEQIDFAGAETLANTVKSFIGWIGGGLSLGSGPFGVALIVDGFLGVEDIAEISLRINAAAEEAMERCDCSNVLR